MSTFEYVTGIYSIVIGLAAANVLSALAETLKYRHEIRWYWVHSAWCVALLFGMLSLWAAIWENESAAQSRSVFSMLPFFIWAVFIYLCSRLLTPDMAREESFDLEAYFFRVRTPFFLVFLTPQVFFFALVFIFDIYPASLLPTILSALIFGVSIVGVVTASRRVHAVLPLAYLLFQGLQEVVQLGLAA